jgi:hypothetical protein
VSQGGLANAGQILDQQVAAGQQGREGQIDDLGLVDDDLGDAGAGAASGSANERVRAVASAHSSSRALSLAAQMKSFSLRPSMAWVVK